MDPTWTEILSAVSTLVAAIAAILIPVVLHRWAKRQDEHSDRREIETRTLDRLDKLDYRVSKTTTEIMKRTKDDYTYAKISGDPELEGLVFTLLNEYAHLCSGANHGLYSRDIIMNLRESALRMTKDRYDDYIKEYRDRKDEEAWCDIDKFLGEESC